MTDEGALKLAEEVLRQAFSDYVNALVYIKTCDNKGEKNLTKKEKRKLNEALVVKQECEDFYRSELFDIYTLGQGVDGESVIKIAQEKATQLM